MSDGGIPMDPTCPRCDGKHGVEVTGDGYEHDCAACGQHLICAIGPDGGEMFNRMRPVFDLARRWRNRPLSVTREWLANDAELFAELHRRVDAAIEAEKEQG